MKINFFRITIPVLLLLLFFNIAEARDRDAIRFGGDIVIQEDETVNSAVAIGGDVTVYGTVNEAAVAIGGSVYIEEGGYVDDDAVSIGGRVHIDKGGILRGNIIDIGELISIASHDKHHRHHYHGIPAFIKILPLIGLLILGTLVIVLLPGSVRGTMDRLNEGALLAFGVGILGLLAFIPMILTLAISLLGIPLIPLFIATYMLTVLLGYIGASTWLGNRILEALKYPGKPELAAFVVGLLVLKIAGLVPGIGGLLNTLVVSLGLGAILITLKIHFSKKPEEKVLLEKAENG